VPESRALAIVARIHQHLKGGPFVVSEQQKLDRTQQAIFASGLKGQRLGTKMQLNMTTLHTSKSNRPYRSQTAKNAEVGGEQQSIW
jgi:hypothetical protein